jgi:glycosyltransferase involved in cell wall biosynthesis
MATRYFQEKLVVMEFPQRQISAPELAPDYRVTDLDIRHCKFALVIPVINEAGRLEPQLARIQELANRTHQVDVIVADGGSSDGSVDPALLASLGVTTLLTKLGPGRLSAQLRMAIHYALETGYEGVITIDGNGKDGVEAIPAFVDALDDGFDFVQGSRFIDGGSAKNTPLSRLWAIRLLHAPITSLGAHHRFTDTTNGFRGHSRKFLSDPGVQPLRDIFTSYELLAYLPIAAGRLGFAVKEVPVSRAYPANEPTPTKIHGLSSYVRLIAVLLDAVRGKFFP